MNTKLVSQKATLSGFAVLFISMLPSLLQAHGTGNEHLHLSSNFSMAPYAFVALVMVVVGLWAAMVSLKKYRWLSK